jgi:hypothetical protein
MENVFWIMTSRFRIFRTQINLKSDRIETTVMNCCVLRNYSYLPLRCTSFGQEESDMEDFEGDESVFVPLQKGFTRHYGHEGGLVTEMYLQFCSHEWKVEWQNKILIFKLMVLFC